MLTKNTIFYDKACREYPIMSKNVSVEANIVTPKPSEYAIIKK